MERRHPGLRREGPLCAALGARIGFAGASADGQAVIPQIVRSQVWSTVCLADLLLAGDRLAAHHARPGWGCMADHAGCGARSSGVFGIMGWFGIPLQGVATSMFSGIALGIAVDLAPRSTTPRALSRSPRGWAWRRRLRALEDAGPAIVIDAVAIAVGFGILTASQVAGQPPARRSSWSPSRRQLHPDLVGLGRCSRKSVGGSSRRKIGPALRSPLSGGEAGRGFLPVGSKGNRDRYRAAPWGRKDGVRLLAKRLSIKFRYAPMPEGGEESISLKIADWLFLSNLAAFGETGEAAPGGPAWPGSALWRSRIDLRHEQGEGGEPDKEDDGRRSSHERSVEGAEIRR